MVGGKQRKKLQIADTGFIPPANARAEFSQRENYHHSANDAVGDGVEATPRSPRNEPTRPAERPAIARDGPDRRGAIGHRRPQEIGCP
jgi:hypothetical protein